MIGVGSDEEVDETGARDLDLGDGGIGRQAGNQRFGQLARILARALGEPHRDVAGKIAVLRITRTFDLDVERARAGRNQRLGQRCQRLAQQVRDQGLQFGSVFNQKGSAVYRKVFRLPARQSIHFERIDVDGPAQAPGTRQCLDQRQPPGQEALQHDPRGRLEQQMSAKMIRSPREQGAGRP